MANLITETLFATCDERLDQQILQEIYEDDLEYALSMFETFNEVMPEETKLLREAFQKKDLNRLGQVAHKIKSNFSLVGLTHLFHLSAILDHQSREASSTEAVEDVYHQLIENINTMLPVIQQETRRLASLIPEE